MDLQSVLQTIAHEVGREPAGGQVADYIPELAKVDPNKFGMALQTIDGHCYGVGDCDEPLSIQSVSKVLALALAMTEQREELWQRIGVEPSGDPFNSLVQLEVEHGIPRNPFINAGAIVVADILVSSFEHPKQAFLDFARSLADDDLEYDLKVAHSEAAFGSRNRAVAHFMRSFGNIRNDVDAVLDLYIAMCSLAMTCRQLARMYAFLASSSDAVEVCGKTLTRSQIKRINALMLTCGFYDESGEFAFRVGLPGKSGVGGGIIAVHPGKYAVAVWSPPLNAKGNSRLGTLALELLTSTTGLSIF